MRARDIKGRSSVGSGAKSALAIAALALAFAVLVSTAAFAAPAVLWQSSGGAASGEQISTARGIGVAPAGAPNEGHVFVNDQNGRRIFEFTAWGEMVKIWGWDVVEAGPGDTAADQLEVCVPADGDVCKGGIQGTAGAGQFSAAVGVAVDSAGNVFAAEAGTPRRVQKFSPDGEFLLSFGGGVNQGGGSPENPGNLCTKAHLENGDTCGAGETGTGPGEFSGPTGSLRTVIAITPDNEVYVGDQNRIQRFDTEGIYQDEIPVPGEGVQQVAVDSAGFLYVSYEDGTNDAEEDVRKLDPVTGEELLTFEVANPRAIAVAANGDVYAFDKAAPLIRRFDADADEIESFGADLNAANTGLATSSACGIPDPGALYASDASGFLRAYRPPPQDTETCPQPAAPPEIVSQYATSVGTTSATVEALINPNFWDDADYYLEYGTEDCSSSPCKRVLFPGAPLTTELTDEAVKARVDLSGLERGTEYHFRFVAKSGGGGPTIGADSTFTTFDATAPETGCPNQEHRGGSSAGLPDCRAYELVSPVDKSGGDVDAYFYEGFDGDADDFAGLDQSTPGGSKLTYTASASFADPEGSPLYPQYIATRSGSSWGSESIDPRQRGGIASKLTGVDNQYKAFSEDLRYGWLKAESGLPLTEPGPDLGHRNLYRRDNETGGLTWLGSSGSPPEPCVGDCPNPALFPEVQGTAADGDCAAFRVNDSLAGAPQGEGIPGGLTAHQLYVWCEGEGVALASVLPGGEALEATSSAGTENGTGGGVAEARSKGRANTVQNAFSEDGSRLYWTASEQPGPTLYLRVNAHAGEESAVAANKCTDPAKACTLQVSHKDPLGETFFGPNRAQFWTASPSGERAIYSIISGASDGELHEYAFDPVEGEGANTLIAKEVLGVAGWSEDATRLYFASEEVCSSEPNELGDEAIDGQPNLYLQEAGQDCAGGLTFIGALAAEDIPAGSEATTPSPLASVPRDHVARATADGGHLTFVSAAPLTGSDNADVASGEPDRQVYLYDAATGALSCASCNPSGARPRGADLGGTETELWTAGWIPGYQHELYGRRPLADNGRRLFFNSLDRLTPRDSNGAQDVYQWEAPGTGGCTTSSPAYSEVNEGCVDLISSGQDKRDSEFVEASASGDDVFFRTEAGLVGADPGLVDIYDARVGGGFPEPSEPISCEGDSCQSATDPPGFPTPASATYRTAAALPIGEACRAPARKAARLSRRAKRLRRSAKRVRKAAKARQMRRRANRLARRAKGQSNRARRCRGRSPGMNV